MEQAQPKPDQHLAEPGSQEQKPQSRLRLAVCGRRSRSKRVLGYCTLFLCLVALFGLGFIPVLRFIGAFLVVGDPLRPAAAIVVLGGDPPFREIEAARLFADGWAPKIIVIPGAIWEQQQALAELGIRVPEVWQTSREVLLKKGVPSSAITVAPGRAEGTLDELRLAFNTIGPVSKPVILVSSKYHTRRVRLTWNYITHGTPRAIVRGAEGDPFDPARWWRVRRFALSVVREYLGILQVYAGFPVPARNRAQPSLGTMGSVS